MSKKDGRQIAETNFVTVGAAAVCKAEIQGLKGGERDREKIDIDTFGFLTLYSKNTEGCLSKIPSETKHAAHVQHASKTDHGHTCCLILWSQQQRAD